MKIKEMNAQERPREKMLSKGVQSLSDAELIAVLLRCGSKDENVLELSRRLLDESGGTLNGFFSSSEHKLLSFKGIGPSKAANLLSCAELGRRYFSEKSQVRHRSIVSARMVYDEMRPLMHGKSREECWALYLNSVNYLLGKELISSGGLESTDMDIREIIRRALERRATGIILVHNHPSLNPSPSRADVERTNALGKACKAVGIKLTDHVIWCEESFYSFGDERICKV